MEISLKKEAENCCRRKTWRTKVRCLFLLYENLRISFKTDCLYPGYHEHEFIMTDDLAGTTSKDESARKIIQEEIIQPMSIERSAEIPISLDEAARYLRNRH